jgi:hypothetical protein
MMDPDIFSLARDCLHSFAGLNKKLLARPTPRTLMPPEAVDNEFGRFRVWCGNLGALQQSFASLDYRLRESPVMLASVCKLLQQLRFNLDESKWSSRCLYAVRLLHLPFRFLYYHFPCLLTFSLAHSAHTRITLRYIRCVWGTARI